MTRPSTPLRSTPLRPALLIALVLALLALATVPVAAAATTGGGSGSGSSGSGKDDASGKGGSDDDDDDDTTTGATTTTTTTTITTATTPQGATTGGGGANGSTTTATTAATARSRSDVRSVGRCSAGVSAWIRVRGDGRTLDVRFELGDVRARALWHLALVHERHVSWKGDLRSGSNRRIRVRRSLRDYAGSDTITAHAWGPAGRSCRVTLAVPA